MKKLLTLFLLLQVLVRTETYADSLYCPINIQFEDSLVGPNNKLSVAQKRVIGGLIAQQAASFYLEYNWWWKHNYKPFSMRSDGGFNNYSLGIDKVGHFYVSYMYSNLLYELMKWADFKESNSEWVSIALPFAWALSIEIGDGYSDFAFSPQDLLANSIGIAYAVAQRKVPYLQYFNCKFSYYPSNYHFINQFKGWSLTSDYDGHIYWVTADINGLLPRSAKKFWPKYLNLGLGYGINNFTEIAKGVGQNLNMQREYLFGLDFNLSNIATKNKTTKIILKAIDYIHFPAPGMKQTNQSDWKFHPLLLN
jgi:hypothetical protein